MDAWKPLPYRVPGLSSPSLGQSSIAFKPPTTATGIGGILLLSGVLSNMFVSTDQRPLAQVVRVAVAGFATYLVIDQSFYKIGPGQPEPSSIVLPAIGLTALVGVLTGAFYQIFR